MNFIERVTVQEANEVDLRLYTFLDKLSATKGIYCFKIRQAKK